MKHLDIKQIQEIMKRDLPMVIVTDVIGLCRRLRAG